VNKVLIKVGEKFVSLCAFRSLSLSPPLFVFLSPERDSLAASAKIYLENCSVANLFLRRQKQEQRNNNNNSRIKEITTTETK
jgi:hypothetical protein